MRSSTWSSESSGTRVDNDQDEDLAVAQDTEMEIARNAKQLLN